VETDSLCSDFFLSILIMVDILSSTTKEPTTYPALALQYLQLLPFTPTNPSLLAILEQTLGIAAWVLESLLHTILLSNWKCARLHTGNLSFTMLVTRAQAIESHIIQNRASLLRQMSSSTLSSTNRNCWILTNIFASATMVYLHTIVSDPRPDVPDILEAVNMTKDAIKLVTDSSLLGLLSWLICVAGSMAGSGDQRRDFWRQLGHGCGERGLRERNLLRAIKVVKEVWRLRDQSESQAKSVKGMATFD
jgi:hypothetical protein